MNALMRLVEYKLKSLDMLEAHNELKTCITPRSSGMGTKGHLLFLECRTRAINKVCRVCIQEYVSGAK